MTKDEIIKALRDMARYPTVTLPRDSEALKVAADLLAQPAQEPACIKEQTGALVHRAFLERVLAAMEGVIDVADRKTDEFDALRDCVMELTLVLYKWPNSEWNAALDEAAARIGEIKGFGRATQDSFAVFIQGLKR